MPFNEIDNYSKKDHNFFPKYNNKKEYIIDHCFMLTILVPLNAALP